jgi:hypothetical protein
VYLVEGLARVTDRGAAGQKEQVRLLAASASYGFAVRGQLDPRLHFVLCVEWR